MNLISASLHNIMGGQSLIDQEKQKGVVELDVNTELISQNTSLPFKRVTESKIIWDNFKKNRNAVIGLIIITFLLLVALFANVISPYDPIEQTADMLSPPTGEHLFGTDALGRDNFSRVIHGSKISIGVGFGAVAISMVIGLSIGVSGGYFGGKVDNFVIILIDIFMSFPGLLLAMVISSLLGPTLRNVMIAVGIGQFTLFARLIRSSVYVEKEKEFVLAAKSIGSNNFFIIIRHILPNILPIIIIITTLNVGNAILLCAALGFLGLGAQPPLPEWGNMVNIGRSYIQIAPWLIWFPGIAIMLSVLGANMLGDGLRDALDPKLRK